MWGIKNIGLILRYEMVCARRNQCKPYTHCNPTSVPVPNILGLAKYQGFVLNGHTLKYNL